MEQGASFFTDLFWASLALIFLCAIIGAVVSRRQRDRCLRLLNDFHVTLCRDDGENFWGDLVVYPQGLELRFDKPHITRFGLQKRGVLIYEKEQVSYIGLFRTLSELTQEEKIQRQAQVISRFRPGPTRRFLRGARNWVGTIQDAFTQAITVALGQVQRTHPAMKSRQTELKNLGQQLVGATGNSWEPMLERLMGKPVVVEVKIPGMENGLTELSGYLAEYSSKYIAIFTNHRDAEAPQTLTLSSDFTHSDFEAEPVGDKWILKSKSLRPWVIEHQIVEGQIVNMGSILINGGHVWLSAKSGTVEVQVRQLKEVDAVLSRSFAVVRFASVEN
jgi:hypothetical protein